MSARKVTLRQRVLIKMARMEDGRFVGKPSQRLFIASGPTGERPQRASVIGIYDSILYPLLGMTQEDFAERVVQKSDKNKIQVLDLTKQTSRDIDRRIDDLFVKVAKQRLGDFRKEDDPHRWN